MRFDVVTVCTAIKTSVVYGCVTRIYVRLRCRVCRHLAQEHQIVFYRAVDKSEAVRGYCRVDSKWTALKIIIRNIYYRRETR